jgi:5-(carboxyamino)imidazole ribonucleotide mutase
MGVGKSGAINAAILAIEILALGDESLAQKLIEYKAKLEVTVAERSAKVASEMGPKG